MYNDLALIKGIFEVGEVVNMSNFFIKALGKVMDKSMATTLKNYILKVESYPESDDIVLKQIRVTVKIMRDELWNKINSYTFFDDIPEYLYSPDWARLPLYKKLEEVSYKESEELYQGLKIILENTANWKDRRLARTTIDFKEFMDEVYNLENLVMKMVARLGDASKLIPYTEDLTKVVFANKYLFHDGNQEKEKVLPSYFIMRNKSSYQALFHAINYKGLR